METVSAALDDCRQRVAGYLREVLGDRVVEDDRTHVFGFRTGSAWVTIRVGVAVDGSPMVATRAFLVTGTELTQEFLYELLSEAGRPAVGGYGLDARDDVFIEHCVPGDGITAAQLRASVLGVANEADRADDAIVARFGGIRMTDERPKPT